MTMCRNRMWSSAMHFAIGFFGYPFEGQYEQSITIEHDGVSLQSLFIIPTNSCQFNNTLAPEKTYVICDPSLYQPLTPPFPVVPTGITLKNLNVPLGISAVGLRSAFEPPFLLSHVIRSTRAQIPQGCPGTFKHSARWLRTLPGGRLCYANDVRI